MQSSIMAVNLEQRQALVGRHIGLYADHCRLAGVRVTAIRENNIRQAGEMGDR
jgi:hypothetical protein